MEASDHEQVARFVAATGVPAEQASFFLEACGGDLQSAVELYTDQMGAPGGALGHEAEQLQPAAPPHRPARAPAQQQGPRRFGVLSRLLQIPTAVISVSLRSASTVLSFGAQLLTAITNVLLPRAAARALQDYGHALAEQRMQPSPQQAAQSFADQFRQDYDGGPQWHVSTFQEAAATARQRFKFLLVYLHSPSHQDSEHFCRSTLCNPEVSQWLDSMLVCWGGNIRYHSAFDLAGKLQAATYPYVALLASQGTQVRLVTAVQGALPPRELLARLRTAVDRNSTHLAAAEADHNQRMLDRRLRSEQDAEYQRALAADQDRERQRQEAAQAEAAKAQAAQDAAAQARAEEEAAEQAKQQAAANQEARKERLRRSLSPEPPSGTPDVAVIRLRFRDGSQMQRRFPAARPLQEVVNFVGSLDQVKGDFSLASSAHRKVLTDDALDRSLSDLQLTPQALLFVQNAEEPEA